MVGAADHILGSEDLPGLGERSCPAQYLLRVDRHRWGGRLPGLDRRLVVAGDLDAALLVLHRYRSTGDDEDRLFALLAGLEVGARPPAFRMGRLENLLPFL